jgi:hypothetical protein
MEVLYRCCCGHNGNIFVAVTGKADTRQGPALEHERGDDPFLIARPEGARSLC